MITTINVRCPKCPDMQFLDMADWEEFTGDLSAPGDRRISLVCNECHGEFILTVSLSEVIAGT